MTTEAERDRRYTELSKAERQGRYAELTKMVQEFATEPLKKWIEQEEDKQIEVYAVKYVIHTFQGVEDGTISVTISEVQLLLAGGEAIIWAYVNSQEGRIEGEIPSRNMRYMSYMTRENTEGIFSHFTRDINGATVKLTA